MVITIEPMLNIGMYHAKVDLDGWTARTVDGSLSAQYEHTLAITANGYSNLNETIRETPNGRLQAIGCLFVVLKIFIY